MRHLLIAVLLVSAFATTGVIVTPHPALAASVSTSPTPTAATAAAATVLFNELSNGGPRSDSDGFFELRNWGDTAVDLTGWSVYRCSVQGLRANVGRPEGDLRGVVLQPGDIFTVSKAGLPGDAHVSQPYSINGFGLYLEAPGGVRADAVGVYPNEPWPTTSECTLGSNLTNTLNFALGESWQRVADTGDPATDFVAAASTIGATNATRSTPRADTGVVISEFAAAGADAADDEFVELLNTSGARVDIGGWELFRCTASGRVRPDTLQLTVAAGTRIAPGERFVIGGPGFTGDADAEYGRELADVTSGVLLQTADDRLVDRVATSNYDDSACQSDKLPAVLDFVADESYQSTDAGFVIAKRTPGRANATRASSVFAEEFAYGEPSVAISEIGNDPSSDQLPGGRQPNNYIELANYGEQSVAIGGYTIRRCEESGIRSREVQATVPEGTVLKPGATFVAARAGTGVEGDVTYDTSLNFLGGGVWVADAAGHRVDSAGVYALNEMDESLVTPSPCTKGVAIATFAPDRMRGETFQRTRFTGVDDDDFVTAPATPGEIDEHEWVDPVLAVSAGTPLPARTGAAEPVVTPGAPATVLEAYSGSSAAPLHTRVGAAETPLDPAAPAAVEDDAWGYPYQRFVLDAEGLGAGSAVTWAGSTSGRNEIQFSVWDAAASEWRLLDAGTSALEGELKKSDLDAGTVTLLAQNGPRTEPTLAARADGALENPDDYDLAISHITDTQYLTETYPAVYAELASWIAESADDRKIAFATHTGDLVQNWVDPNQDDTRARREFERASAAQGILDAAGVPNSVLPGNHDNKRGVTNDLFNEYFPPSRYAGTASYAGSIAPDDNSANYSTFEQGGARFLMLSLPYAYGEAEIEWASEVVTSHPDHNVVVSTHEHVTPKTDLEDAHRSANSRWVSNGQKLWDRVIAPNRNVVVVLSGHFHGIGQIATENAGGIEGHDVVELLADYQEFRTHTGERATGFQRLLQIDLASSTVAVDTFSVRLDASASFDYDYQQFRPENGHGNTLANGRPWRIVEAGVQNRYTAADDEFGASVGFQYAKRVDTSAITVKPTAEAPLARSSSGWRWEHDPNA
ncbi:lamin tail domain-containing protein [Conyzicola sp.]|uniref:lamin tail domain-containing protein n=1 Tax=Conyzicola sp. TaxID=1969404 RepID=UPI0039895600